MQETPLEPIGEIDGAGDGRTQASFAVDALNEDEAEGGSYNSKDDSSKDDMNEDDTDDMDDGEEFQTRSSSSFALDEGDDSDSNNSVSSFEYEDEDEDEDGDGDGGTLLLHRASSFDGGDGFRTTSDYKDEDNDIDEDQDDTDLDPNPDLEPSYTLHFSIDPSESSSEPSTRDVHLQLQRFESFAKGIGHGDCSSPVTTRLKGADLRDKPGKRGKVYEVGRLLRPRDGLGGVLPPLYPEDQERCHSHGPNAREVSRLARREYPVLVIRSGRLIALLSVFRVRYLVWETESQPIFPLRQIQIHLPHRPRRLPRLSTSPSGRLAGEVRDRQYRLLGPSP
jgi:hypothetical protein